MIFIFFILYLALLFGLSFLCVRQFSKAPPSKRAAFIGTAAYLGAAIFFTTIYIRLVSAIFDLRPALEMPEDCLTDEAKRNSFQCVPPNIIAPLSFENIFAFVLYPALFATTITVLYSGLSARRHNRGLTTLRDKSRDILFQHLKHFIIGLLLVYGFFFLYPFL
jgi:hypothetical protein